MAFLKLLEGLRFPALNALMLGITELGSETAFLVVALVLFWCVDKRKGYYLMAVGFLGTTVCQFLKILCRVPRPWILDETFTALEQAKPGASDFSFPSGHTMNAVGTYGGMALTTKRKPVRIAAVLLAVLVPFSRMYVGVHTPKDVLTAAVLALALIFLLRPVSGDRSGRILPVLLPCMAVLSLLYLWYLQYVPMPLEGDTAFYESALRNACSLTGAVLGVCLVYPLDTRLVRFREQASLPVQILKAVLGLALVLAVKTLLKAPLEAVLPVHPARQVRYFLVVLFAGLGWPACFPLLRRLERKNHS